MIESLAIFRWTEGGCTGKRRVPDGHPSVRLRSIPVVRLMRAGELSYYGREGEVAKSEDGFCEYLGMPYGLAVGPGAAALHSAYFGLGLEPGDEVIVPTYTFLATVMPLFVLNVVPVLCDAETDTGNLDPAEIEKHIGPRTRAIVVTHLWGHPCDLPRISQIAKRHRLSYWWRTVPTLTVRSVQGSTWVPLAMYPFSACKRRSWWPLAKAGSW